MTTITSASSTSAATGAAGRTTIAADFNTFLKLLTAQLKNQDPLAPMDAEKFTSQLVQFSQVEQQLASNKHLARLAELGEASSRASAVGYLGAQVTIDGQVVTKSGQAVGSVAYRLERDAAEVTLDIYDAGGTLVQSQAGKLGAGAQVMTWDGRKADGTLAADGAFRVAVKAKDALGRAIPVSVESSGRVDRVLLGDTGVTLDVAGASIPLSAVRSVARPVL